MTAPGQYRARLVLERLGRRHAFPRRFPRSLGGARMLASTEGGLRYLFRRMADVDPMLVRFSRQHVHPGQVVWDVGANLGYFSLLAAGRVGSRGEVCAVEPDVWLADLLVRSAIRPAPGHGPVRVIPAAVSDAAGLATLHIAARARACNFVDGTGTTMTGGVRHEYLVASVTLDGLLRQLRAPDVVKIDIEGGEALALAGAAAVLHEVRPVLLIEVSAGNAPLVTRLLTDAGYRLHDYDAPDVPRIDEATLTTLAVPIETATG